MLLTFLLALASGLDVLDPFEVRSPSGTWRLEVDPQERRGVGDADFRCWSGGELAWEGRLPFTLQRSCVTDDGLIAGVARRYERETDRGEVLAVVIDCGGRARVIARATERMSEAPHAPPWPSSIEGPLVTPSSNGGVGAALFFLRSDGRSDAPAIWTIDLEKGELVASSVADLGAWGGRTFDPQPTRKHARPATAIQLDTRAIPRVTLARLSDIEVEPIAWYASLALGDDGSVALLVFETKQLRVHEADGSHIATVRDALPIPAYWKRVDPLPLGRWSVQGVRVARVFDTTGIEAESCARVGPWSGRETIVRNGVTRGWSWRQTFSALALVDPTGAVASTLERRADRRWLGHVGDVAFAPDGKVIVLEERTWEASPPRTSLHVLSPLGSPLEQWDLPFETCDALTTRLHPIGRRIVVCGEAEGPLVLDLDDARGWRIGLGPPRGERNVLDAVPARDGTELWVLRANSAAIERYALPRTLD